MLAPDLATLHTIDGDHELFLDENGEMVNGQWADSPDPNEHDILTGSNKDGTVVPGKTCADWTSEDPTLFAQVGHSDGLGPNMNDAEMYRPVELGPRERRLPRHRPQRRRARSIASPSTEGLSQCE
jgi:hypothetical protein